LAPKRVNSYSNSSPADGGGEGVGQMTHEFPFQGEWPDYRVWRCHASGDLNYRLLVDLEEGADQGVLTVQFKKGGPWELYRITESECAMLGEKVGAFRFDSMTGSLRFCDDFTIELDHSLYGDIVLAALAQPNAHWDDVFSIVMGKIVRGWDWNIWVHQGSITAPFYLQVLKMAGKHNELRKKHQKLEAAAAECHEVLRGMVARKDGDGKKTPLAALVESPQPVRFCAVQVVERVYAANRPLETVDPTMSVSVGALTATEK